MDSRTGIMDFNGSGKDLIELYEKRTSLSGATVTTHYVSQTYGQDLGSIFIMNANLGGLGLAGTVGANCGHKFINGTDIGSMFCTKRTVVPFLTTFTPLSASGCWIWLDAGDSTKITQSSNAVSAWTDKSTNVYSFTQATAGNQPAYVANSLNGQSTLSFTSTSNQYLGGPTNFAVGTNCLSIFIVFKFNSSTSGINYESVFGKSFLGDQLGRFYCYRTGTNMTFDIQQEAPQTSTYSLPNFSNTSTSWQIIELVVNRVSGNSYIFQNGIQVSTKAYTSNTSVNLTNANPLLVGEYNNITYNLTSLPNYNLNGSVAEIVGFSNSSDMSSTTRQNIEGYLARKWGLQTLLPKDHPSLTVLNGSFSQTIIDTNLLSTTANQINNWTHNANNSTNLFGIIKTADTSFVDGTSTTYPYVALPGITQYLMSKIVTTNVAITHFIKQTITIPAEGLYTLSFYHAGRINSYSTNHTLKVDIGTSNIVSGLATTSSGTVSAVGWQLFTSTMYFSGNDVGTKDLTLTFTNSSISATDSAFFITGIVLNYLSPLIGSGLLTSVPTSCSCLYACRWVNNNYFGPILRLRRSTDSAIQDFFINSAGTTIGTLPNGTGTIFATWLGTAPTAYVDTWYDQSGKGNHTLSTGNIADQPVYESSTNSVNCTTVGTIKYPVIKDSSGVALAGDINVSLMCKFASTPAVLLYPFALGTGGAGFYTSFVLRPSNYTIESGAGGGSIASTNGSLVINDVLTAVINTKSNVKMFRSNGSVQKDNGSGVFGSLNILQTSTVASSNNKLNSLKYSAVCVFNTNISDNDRITMSSII